MAVVRCSKGHFYDDQRFSHCPHCGIFTDSPGKAAPEQEGQAPGAAEKRKGLFGWLDREKTVALSPEKAAMLDEGKTVAFSEQQENPLGDSQTVALNKVSDSLEDDQRTIGLYSGAKGNDYVTGWLVCVEGAEKGRDYRLHHGFNRVGRNFSMDVQVMDDPAISREGHCAVVYDDKNNQFSLLPQNGTITYFKGQMLAGPETLYAGDEIRLGNSCFVFIPFCGEGRVWEKEEE